MLEHARRALPWPLLGGLSLLILGMLALLGRWPGPLWPLGGVAVGVLAAGAAWCVDEPVPEITDTAARSVAWRLSARALGVAVLATAWVGGMLVLVGELAGRRADVLGQGVAAVVAVVGLAAFLRAQGMRHPGRALAPYVALITMGVAVGRPVLDWLPAFPGPGEAAWGPSRSLWVALATLGVVGLVLAVVEARWWRAPGYPHT